MNKDYYDILISGVDKWNQWRRENLDVIPDLRDADLAGADLQWAHLRHADLRDADLRGANLRCADLAGADLRRADLCEANLRCAYFREADLRSVDFCEANFQCADLRGADLTGANLHECIGNMREIKSIQLDTWPVVYTSEVLYIGCQSHRIADWWAFPDEEISVMEVRALSWWKRWEPILQQIIEASPAVPTKQEDK